MADQIMTTSKLRLRNRMGVLSARDIGSVENAILLHLGMSTKK
jgi:mRNA-degrading endonuclease toxin of MazEF toxin-antitoxin module